MSRKNWIKTEYRFIYYIILWIIVLLFICELYLHKFLPGPYIAQTHGDPYLDAYLGFYDSSMKNIKFLPVTQGKKRILIVGDSFVYNNSFTKYFEECLSENINSLDIQILSSPGWGTDQEYTAFQILAKKFKPDIVITAFCLWNDIANNLSVMHPAIHSGIKGKFVKPFFSLDKEAKLVFNPLNSFGTISFIQNENVSYKIKRYLYINCRIFFYINRLFNVYKPVTIDEEENIDGRELTGVGLWNDVFDNKVSGLDKKNYMITDRISHVLPMIVEPEVLLANASIKSDIKEYGYLLTEKLLSDFRGSVESYGGEFYLFLLPFANVHNLKSGNSNVVIKQRDGSIVKLDYMYQIKRLHDICRRNSVNVIDVTEKIEKQNTDLSKLINGVTDCHYNERGKKVVGELLAQAFMGSVK